MGWKDTIQEESAPVAPAEGSWKDTIQEEAPKDPYANYRFPSLKKGLDSVASTIGAGLEAIQIFPDTGALEQMDKLSAGVLEKSGMSPEEALARAERGRNLAIDGANIIGNIGQTAGKALGQVVREGPSAAASRTQKVTDYLLKKAGKIGGNIPEDTTDYYLKNSARVNAAPSPSEMATKFVNEQYPAAREALGEASAKARELLPVESVIPKLDVRQAGQDAIDEILSGPAGNLTRKAAGGEAGKSIQGIQNELDKILSGFEGETLTPADLGQAVRDLQDLAYKYDGSPELSATGEGMRKLAGKLNAYLKDINPAYKDAMVPVAEKTKDLKAAEVALINRANPTATDRFLLAAKKVPNQAEQQATRKSLESFDKAAGTNLIEQIKDADVARAFQKQDTAGSRKTILGGAIGGALGTMTGGFLGASAGGAAGAALGAGFDRYSGPVLKAIIDKRISAGQGAMKLAERYGKYAEPLAKAAERGGAALTSTQFLLQKTDPEFRRLQQEQQE